MVDLRIRNGFFIGFFVLVLAACGGGGGDGSADKGGGSVQPNNPAPTPTPAVDQARATGIQTIPPQPRTGSPAKFFPLGYFPGGTKFSWDFGDGGLASNDPLPEHTYGSPNIYAVKFTATDLGGRVSTYTGSIQSKTNQPPKLDAVLTTNASLIVGTPISLGVTATDLDYDLLTYTWFVDGKQVAEKTQDYQITYTFATSGTHTITVSVRDDFGGKDSRDYAMQILDNPVIKPPPVPVDPPPNPVKWKKVSDAFSQENNIRFFADGTGWVISMYQAQALRTIDKGVTWQSVALPKSDMGGASGFRDIAFANSKEGWVVGCPQLRTTRPTPDSWRLDFGYGRAGHTTDGGQTWENVEINLPSKGLDCFVAVQLIGVKGWILTSGGELMGTTDAGKNWSLLSRLTTEPSRMQFVDELHGWMINTVPSTTMKLSRTTDGGKTWTTTELPNSSDMNSLMGFSFFDKDTGYVSAQGRFLEPYKLLKTTDGGVTWSELPVHTRSTLGEATFASASVGYVIDGYGAFYKTNDGGLSWNQVAMTPPELADMYPLAVDSQGAWWTAVGGIHVNGGLYKLILP